MTNEGNPNPSPVPAAVPAGWHTNPASGQREWWDGSAWTQPPAKPPVAALAIISLVLGALAFLTGLVPVLGLLLALAGAVVGIIALVKKAKPNWMAGVGLGLAGLSLVTSVVVLAAFGSGLANAGNVSAQNPIQAPSAQKPDESTSTPAPAEVTESAAPEEAAPPEPSLTLAQQQAVGTAESYLAYQSFSRKGLIEQLEFEGFDKADAVFAVDSLNVDWNDQAAKKAAEYLKFQTFSKKSLIEQLEFEGFTKEQAQFGAQAVGY